MKKSASVFAWTMAALGLIGPAFAQTTNTPPLQPSMKDSTTDTMTTPTTPDKGATVAPSEKHGKLFGLGRHHVTANVVAVDGNAKTITVKKGAKGKEMTFTVADNAVSRLSDIKEGDRVK